MTELSGFGKGLFPLLSQEPDWDLPLTEDQLGPTFLTPGSFALPRSRQNIGQTELCSSGMEATTPNFT